MAIKKQTKRKSSGSKRRAGKRLAKKRPSKPALKKKAFSRKKQTRPQKRRVSSKKKRTSVKKRKRTRQRVSRKARRKLKARLSRKPRRKVRRTSKKGKVVPQNIEDFSKEPHECLSIDDKEAAKPNKKPVIFVTTPKGVAVSCPVDPADGQGRIFIGNKEGGDFLLVESHFDNKPKTADKTETVKVDDCSESYEMVDMLSTGENSDAVNSKKREHIDNPRFSFDNTEKYNSVPENQASAMMKRSPSVADSAGQHKPPIAERVYNPAAEERRDKDEPSFGSYN